MNRVLLFAALAIFLPVSAGAADVAPKIPSQVSNDGSTVSISAKVSLATPYQNQPVLYTIRCVVRGAISKVALEDIGVANAIVERQGKPEVSDQVENGVSVRVLEIHYIITPLHPGKMIVPPAVLKGEIEALLVPMIDPFGGQFMMSPRAQQAMNFFSANGGQPFNIASNTTELNVKPPAAAMDPWLALKSLKIKEESDVSQRARVGEPLVRKITLRAQGAVGSQLPDLEAQQDQQDFKVYADTPTMGTDVDKETRDILGWRTESYSLIPQRAGRFVLPAIKVKWWNIATNKIVTADLPQRAVDVLPGAMAPPIADPAAIKRIPRHVMKQSAQAKSSWADVLSRNAVPLVLTGLGLAAALLFVLWWRPRNAGGKARARRTLTKIRTAEELRDFLRAYAHEHMGRPKNASLEEIFSASSNSRDGRNRADAEAIIAGVNGALYAGKAVDVEDLKKRCRRILAARGRRGFANGKGREKLPLLNPG